MQNNYAFRFAFALIMLTSFIALMHEQIVFLHSTYFLASSTAYNLNIDTNELSQSQETKPQTPTKPPQSPTPLPTQEPKTGTPTTPDLHIIFSTGCNQRHSSLQALMLQFTAMKVGHTGPLTRIVSGCSEAQKQELQQITALHPDYRLHFTPDYGQQKFNNDKTDSYAPYNKPFALRHWLNSTTIKESTIALVDVDFIFFKQLPYKETTNKFTLKYSGLRNQTDISTSVQKGTAVAQDWYDYMHGGYWTRRKDIIKEVCKDQPCASVSEFDAKEYYAPTGPPYIMNIDDMRSFVDDYCHFTVEIRKRDDFWMAEMYGFALASANHGIKFTILIDLGITHPQFKREYWSFTKSIETNPCVSEETDSSIFDSTGESLPIGLHLCQKYSQLKIGTEEWNYYKYGLPSDLLNCDSWRLTPPPSELWELANQHEKKEQKRAEVWAQCTSSNMLNRVLLEYKKKACPNGFNSNRSFRMVSPKSSNSAFPTK